MRTAFASERYGTSIAPERLRLTQELANTIAHPRPPVGSDLLGEITDAQRWLDAQTKEWCARHRVEIPLIQLRPRSLGRLRQLRATVRALIDPDATSDPALLTAPLTVTAAPGGSHLSPAATGIVWVRAAIVIEWSEAEGCDQLRRLKLCRNPGCRVAFYDRSKNNSRTWHDVSTCGNRANVQAYRARKRPPSTDP
jgi:hypothetical protein